MSRTKSQKPVTSQPNIPSVNDRLDRIHRQIALTIAALEGIAAGSDAIDPQDIAQHCSGALYDAEMELAHLNYLGADVLNAPAPDHGGGR